MSGLTRKGRAVIAHEQGSATPVVLAALAVIVMVGLAAVQGGAVMVAETKVEATADLAALGAARVDRDSRAQGARPESALRAGCAAAREVSSRNGASLTECVRGPRLSVVVTVEMRVRAWPESLRAAARAGQEA